MPPKRKRFKPLLALALVSLAAPGEQIGSIDVTRDGQRYTLEGDILVGAPLPAVYAVITDFENLAELDEGIVESRVIERPSDSVALVYTRLAGCVLFICRDVERVERVEEVSDNEVYAEVVPERGGDIEFEQSRWLLSSAEDSTRVVYRTVIDPSFWVPPVIGPFTVKRVLRKHLEVMLGNLEQAAVSRE